MSNSDLKNIAQQCLKNPEGFKDPYAMSRFEEFSRALTSSLQNAGSAEGHTQVLKEVEEIMEMGFKQMAEVCKEEGMTSKKQYAPLLNRGEREEFLQDFFKNESQPTQAKEQAQATQTPKAIKMRRMTNRRWAQV